MSSGDATGVVPGTAASTPSPLAVSFGDAEYILPVLQGGSPTGVHTTNDRASLSVTLLVPSDATALSFDWKFGSEELPQFFEGNYQDYFTAILNGTTVVERTWVDKNITNGANLPNGTSGSPTPPFPNPDNTLYNSTTPDIRTALADVVPFRGQPVTIVFHVADAHLAPQSDTLFDSGAFLDNLGFDTSCADVRFEYVAKIICGRQQDPQNMRLARGFYATTINIHNPNEDVTFLKKIAFTFPPHEQEPGEVRDIDQDRLLYDQALKTDCIEIQKKFFPDGFPNPFYIEGFVVIQSPLSLDVTAVYTSLAVDGSGSSIEVEQIRERQIRP